MTHTKGIEVIDYLASALTIPIGDEEAAGDPAYCHRPEEKHPFIRPADPGLHFHHLFFMTHMFEGRSTNWSTVRRHHPAFP